MGKCRIETEPPVYIAGALGLLLIPIPWLLALILAAAVHEAFHWLAISALGGQVWRFRIGISGARMEIGPMPPWQEMICAGAGPLGSLSLLLLRQWLPRTAICALVQGLWNLLPVYPLDGGRILRCLFRITLGRWGGRICAGVEGVLKMILLFCGVTLGLGLPGMDFLLLPVILTAVRDSLEKYLAKAGESGYNRPIYGQKRYGYDRFTAKNTAHSAKARTVHRR